MRALTLLAWRRAGNRHDVRDSARARYDADEADGGLAVVGDLQREAAWARFGAQALESGHDARGRDDEATADERGLPSVAARLGNES